MGRNIHCYGQLLRPCLSAPKVVASFNIMAADAALSRINIHQKAAKITLFEGGQLNDVFPAQRLSRITIFYVDRNERKSAITSAQGDPGAFLSYDEIVEKSYFFIFPVKEG